MDTADKLTEAVNIPQKFVSQSRTKLIRALYTLCAVLAVGFLIYFYRGLFIAATVNGSPIMRFAVIKQLEQEGGKQILESLIAKKIVEQEIEKRNITITEDDITDEIKKAEAMFSAQGTTLQKELSRRGYTQAYLRNQVQNQLKLKKIVADRISVTDADVEIYIKDNKISLPKGKEADVKKEIRVEIEEEKISAEMKLWIAQVKTEAQIRQFVTY